MTHNQSHGHEHKGHSHTHAHGGNEKTVGIAALLTGSFMLVEMIGGVIAGSLALIADAGHMLTDFAALSLAWFAFRLTRRPASTRLSYGFDRVSVMAAFVNGLALFLIAIWICVEAIERLSSPSPIEGGLMLSVAVIGLLVNLLCFWVLTRGETNNLNIRAAILHVAGDLLGSVAAIVAATVILLTDWTPIDPILSVLVAVIILRAAWAVIRDSAHILLEGAPETIDHAEIQAELQDAIPGLVRVHHIHTWSITQERPMATLQAEITQDADPQMVKDEIKTRLQDRFGLGHSTVEIDAPRAELS